MRIIVADHHAHSCWALRLLLDEQPGFDVIGEAMGAQGLLVLAEEHPADLVLVDQELPGITINELLARLHALQPRPIVIVMSSSSEYGSSMLEAGADAFVSKADQPDWLLEKLYKYARKIEMKEDGNLDNRP